MDSRAVSIAIKSTQKLSGESDVTIEEYSGTLVVREDSQYISYKRNTEEGDVSVLMNFGADKMTLTQKGIVSSKMEFVPGKKTANPYQTPAGVLNLDVFTKIYKLSVKSQFISVKLVYDLTLGGDPLETDMDISIKLL